MFVSIFTTAMGLVISLLTVLVIPHGDPVINGITGLIGICGILGGCIGIYFHDKNQTVYYNKRITLDEWLRTRPEYHERNTGVPTPRTWEEVRKLQK